MTLPGAAKANEPSLRSKEAYTLKIFLKRNPGFYQGGNLGSHPQWDNLWPDLPVLDGQSGPNTPPPPTHTPSVLSFRTHSKLSPAQATGLFQQQHLLHLALPVTAFIYNPIAVRVEDGLLACWPLSPAPRFKFPLSWTGFCSPKAFFPPHCTDLSFWHVFTWTLDLTDSYLFFSLSLDFTSSLEVFSDPPECGMVRRKSHTLHCPPSVTSLDFHCPIWQPLNTCVYSALEVGLVQLEMCRKCKLCTGDTLDILDKIKYIFRVNFICILLLFSIWLLENSKLQMWLAIYFYWITLVEAASSMRTVSGQSCSLSILYAMCIQWTSWFTHSFHRY